MESTTIKYNRKIYIYIKYVFKTCYIYRRDGLGGCFIGGKSPELHEEPSIDDLDVDHEYFDNKVWPALAHRVPAFENLKVRTFYCCCRNMRVKEFCI